MEFTFAPSQARVHDANPEDIVMRSHNQRLHAPVNQIKRRRHVQRDIFYEIGCKGLRAVRLISKQRCNLGRTQWIAEQIEITRIMPCIDNKNDGNDHPKAFQRSQAARLKNRDDQPCQYRESEDIGGGLVKTARPRLNPSNGYNIRLSAHNNGQCEICETNQPECSRIVVLRARPAKSH